METSTENQNKTPAITGDFHTHTVYSHGKGTVRENVATAKALGLKRIGITDHAFGHFVYGVSRRSFQKQLQEVESLRMEETDIEILLGVEGDLTGLDGEIDVTPEQYAQMDILLAGFHVSVFGAKCKDQFRYIANGLLPYIGICTKKMKERNTEAYVNAIKRNPIDILTHPNYHVTADVVQVAKAASEYGTFLELSSRHLCIDDDQIRAMLKTDVCFVLNSDAHKLSDIGNVAHAIETVKRLGIPKERVVNLQEDAPDFRLSKWKKNR